MVHTYGTELVPYFSCFPKKKPPLWSRYAVKSGREFKVGIFFERESSRDSDEPSPSYTVE